MPHAAYRFPLFALLAASWLALSGGVSAASPCKGLDKKQCGNQSACAWVDAYQTKNGNPVQAYCRGKGGRKSDSAAGVSKDKRPTAGDTTTARK